MLETLVIDGDENTVLVPGDRYAQMRNVYFIPSALALKNWLKKCGFVDIRIADVSVTTTEEQRRTEWMVTESLVPISSTRMIRVRQLKVIRHLNARC